MDTALTSPFADGEYRFWLPLPQVFELERECGSMLALEERLRAGIGQDGAGGAVFVGGGDATAKEIREVIRIGLIGGNNATVDGEEKEVGPTRAKALVSDYTYPARPLAESAALAWSILSAAIFGIELKKKSDPEGDPSTSLSEKA